MTTTKSYQSKTDGFVALMGSIVISMVLLMIATEAAWLGWSARFMVLTAESKESSVYLAHRCASQVMNRLLQDSTYPGDETISYENGTCQVAPLLIGLESEPIVTIQVRVESGEVVTHHEYLYQLTGIHTGEPLPTTTMSLAVTPTVQLVGWRER